MRVPGPVKAVFDVFPLETYPAIPAPGTGTGAGAPGAGAPDGPVLYTYSLSAAGQPQDPRGLAAAALLRLAGTPAAAVVAASPYMTARRELPLVLAPGAAPGAAPRTAADLVKDAYPAAEPADPAEPLYRALINNWLHDAWLTSILEPEAAAAAVRVYSPPADAARPWPLQVLVSRQLREHLDDQKSFDAANTLDAARVRLCLRALDAYAARREPAAAGKPGLVDVLIYAYVHAILEHIPDSALGIAVAGTQLAGFAQRVAAQIEGLSTEKAV